MMKRAHSFFYLLDEMAEEAQSYADRILTPGDIEILESAIFVDADDTQNPYELRLVTSRALSDFEQALLIQDTLPATYALNLEIV